MLYLASKQTGEEKTRTENQIAELTNKIFIMEQFYFLREIKAWTVYDSFIRSIQCLLRKFFNAKKKAFAANCSLDAILEVAKKAGLDEKKFTQN